MSDPSNESGLAEVYAPAVQFDYIKGSAFHVIHVDGAIGGLTPSGLIHMALFSERGAIPKSVRHKVSPLGELGPPLETEGRQGFVRELDVDAIMTTDVAGRLILWLEARIAEAEAVAAEREQA